MYTFFRIIFLLALSTTYSYAQSDFGRALNKPGFYVDYFVAPDAKLQHTHVNQSNLKTGYQLWKLSGDFNMLHRNPHNSGKITHITGELSFRYHRFSQTESANASLPRFVFGIDYLVAATHTFNSRWSVIGVASVGLFSDFKKITADDFLVSGGFLGVFAVNTHLHVGIGPVLTYAFGEPVLMPAPYVNWYFGKKFLLDIQAPSHAILHYNLSKLLHLKLASRFQLGTKYNVSVPDNDEDWNLLFSEGTLGVDTQFQLGKHFAFWISVKHTFYRKLAFSQMSGFNPEIIPEQDYSPKQSFLTGAGLSWWF